MNSSHVLRIVWKDYRTFRSIWLALFVLSMLLQALVMIIGFWNADLESVKGSPIVLTLGMPVVFAVAVSSVAFSQEHEVGTYRYLQSLPLASWDLFVARLLHVLVSGLVMFCALSLLLPILVALVPVNVDLSRVYLSMVAFSPLYASLSLLAIAIGTLSSLLTKHPLRAALITAIVVCVLQALGSVLPSTTQLLLTSVIAVAVLGIDIRLSQNWLVGDRTVLPTRWLARRFGHNTRATVFRHAWGRLIWTHQRRLRWIYLLIVGFVLFLTVGTGPPLRVELLFLTQVIAGALGVSIFYVDQRDQAYRFYAEHGVSPRLVWAARHLMGLILLLVICIGIYFTTHRDVSRLSLTLTPLLAYGCGQLTMLMTRSSLIAIFVSFSLSLMTAGWCWMADWLHVPWWIVIIPFPLALFVASWVRVPSWMLERDTIRHTGWPLGIAVAGLVLTVALLGIFRVVEIPNVASGTIVTPGLPVPPNPGAKAAQSHLLQAADLVGPWNPTSLNGIPQDSIDSEGHEIDSERVETVAWIAPKLDETSSDWLKQNQDALAQVEAAFQQADQLAFPAYPGKHLGFSFRSELHSLTHLLITQALRLQAEGELDAAWQHYRHALELAVQLRSVGGLSEWAGSSINERLVYDHLIWWAAADGQELEKIEDAIAYLNRLRIRYPDSVDAFLRQHGKKDRVIVEAPESLEQLEQLKWPIDELQRIAFVYRLMPWERVRSRRALRFHEAGELASLIDYTTAIKNGWPVESILQKQSRREVDPKSIRTVLTPQLLTAAYVYSQIDATLRNRHRAAIIQLALIGWKKKHGDYPESLNDLDEGIELQDIFTGRKMIYFSDGKQLRLFVDLNGRQVTYPVGHPFLWSPGLNLKRRYGPDPSLYTSYAHWMPKDSARHRQLQIQHGYANAEELIWRSGLLYGLP